MPSIAQAITQTIAQFIHGIGPALCSDHQLRFIQSLTRFQGHAGADAHSASDDSDILHG